MNYGCLMLFAAIFHLDLGSQFYWQRKLEKTNKMSQKSVNVDGYIFMHVGDQEGRVGIPLTSLTLPYFCACPEPGQGFPMSYVMGFFVFRELW
jgi:hypothetical protein